MPELPEVETARRLTHAALSGRRLVEVHVARDEIIYESVTPQRVRRALRGARVTGSARKGKHFWLELDRRPWPLFHLGMSGWLHTYRSADERPPYWKLELVADDGVRAAYTNMRRIGRIRLRDDPPQEAPIAELGFDALAELPRAPKLAALLRTRRAPVKAVLLDQHFCAGIGNWIADELLYQAGINPARPACELSTAEVQRLRKVWKRVITHAVAVRADDSRFPRTWLFHHRWGKNHGARTAAGHLLEFTTVGGRTTAWAPAVQV